MYKTFYTHTHIYIWQNKKSEVAQSCPTIWDPIHCSLPGSSVHGIFQARILEWIAIFFSRGSSWPRNQTQVSCVAGRFFIDWAMREARRPRFNSWVGKIHWRKDRLPTPVFLGFPCDSDGKESACNAGDLGSIPGMGRSPGERKGFPLQYSGLENSMDYTVHRVTKSQTWLSNFYLTKLTVENSSRDGNTRPPGLPPEKSVCRSRSNS